MKYNDTISESHIFSCQYMYLYSLIDYVIYEDDVEACFKGIKIYLNDFTTDRLNLLKNYIENIDINTLDFKSDPSEIVKKNKCLIGIIEGVISDRGKQKR